MKPALVILAAGASERLGECKALVRIGPATVLEHLVRAGACCDGAPVLVISGADHAAIAAHVPLGCELAYNADWKRGRTGGVQLAQRLRAGLDLCLAPVDVPLVPRPVFASLCAAWLEAGAPAAGWLAPRLDSSSGMPTFGHPVVVGRRLLELLERFTPSTPLRELRGLAERAWSIPVPHPEIADDLDDPADLERLRARFRLNSG